MLGSGNDGPAAPDGYAPRMPDGVKPVTQCDDPVIPRDMPVVQDFADPGIPVVDASMTPGASPGEGAVASLDKTEGVVLDEKFPAPCCSVPGADEESSAPCCDFSSSRRMCPA